MRTNIVLLALAIVLTIPCYLAYQDLNPEFQQIEAEEKMFPGFNKANVHFVAIERRKPADPNKPNAQPEVERVVMQRDGTGKWVLGDPPQYRGVPIKPGYVERQILDHMAAIPRDLEKTPKKPDEVDKDDQKDWRLDDDRGLFITCKPAPDAEAMASLVKGRRRSEGRTNIQKLEGYYVARADDRKTVIIYEPPQGTWEVQIDVNEWIDKTIQDIKLEDLEQFGLRNQKGMAVFRKKAGSEATWLASKQPDGTGNVRQSQVMNLLEKIRKVKAENYTGMRLDSISTKQLEEWHLTEGKSVYELRGTRTSGAEVWLRIGGFRKENNDHLAVGSDCKFVFTLPPHVVQSFGMDPEELFDPAQKKLPGKKQNSGGQKNSTNKTKNGTDGPGKKDGGK